MEQFTFELQRKFTQWESGEFTVIAETYEEAVAKAKEMVTDYSSNDEICNGDGWTALIDTCEYIFPSENNGYPTEELLDENHNTIWHNGNPELQALVQQAKYVLAASQWHKHHAWPEWKDWNGIDSLQAINADEINKEEQP